MSRAERRALARREFERFIRHHKRQQRWLNRLCALDLHERDLELRLDTLAKKCPPTKH